MLNAIVEKIIADRGVTAGEREAFLRPSVAGLAGPGELPGVVEAADVVLAAVAAGRETVVFGDYDCDGVCASAILSRTLRALGGKVSEFLPDRLSEGYGMSDASVARMLAGHPGVGLVITVDNGINSVSQVAELKRRGISVVVTDHHLCGEELPAADALVNPKVAAPPHLSELCGAGVAFLLANRIMSEAKRRGLYDGPSVAGPMLVLAGLATVTDIMPVTGQNRILVAEALRNFARFAPVGLKELYCRAAKSARSDISSRDFGFLLGPRINAAGRMASGMEALELLLCDDREIVRELAYIIDGRNNERKAVEQKMVDGAMAALVPGAPAQVICLPDGHPGVAGIVASRVMERLGGSVPVCVYAGGHGSARAPAGFNIRDAFVACAGVLERFGGHAAAGGFLVKEGMTDEFRRLLCEYCQAHPPAPVSAGEKVDVWIEADDVDLSLAEDLRLLEPYGEGNEEPVFGIRGVYFSDVRPMGSDGRHLSAVLRRSGLRAVKWGAGDQVEKLRAASAAPHDITFTVEVSDYRERHAELRLHSVA
ncbi:MAG: DHH family phosphoesterase [Kiritimatiellae bacterium]|nr:DHH family phosphoesterase [Kiritimatiellia bacterium]